jgi:hypothetical protein
LPHDSLNTTKFMKIRFWAITFGICLLDIAAVQHSRGASADDISAKGRALLKTYGATIVGIEVQATAKVSIDGAEIPSGHIEENAEGTVVADNGLTVTSFGSIDITTIIRSRHIVVGPKAQLKVIEASYDCIKLRFADGSVCQAVLLSSFPALDLAFLRPSGPLPAGRTIDFVNLEKSAKPIILGSYFDLCIGPKDLGWPQEIHPTTIVGLSVSPHRFFMVNYETRGCPVLDADGEPLGISVRAKSSTGNGISIVVSSSEILAAEPH